MPCQTNRWCFVTACWTSRGDNKHNFIQHLYMECSQNLINNKNKCVFLRFSDITKKHNWSKTSTNKKFFPKTLWFFVKKQSKCIMNETHLHTVINSNVGWAWYTTFEIQSHSDWKTSFNIKTYETVITLKKLSEMRAQHFFIQNTLVDELNEWGKEYKVKKYSC